MPRPRACSTTNCRRASPDDSASAALYIHAQRSRCGYRVRFNSWCSFSCGTAPTALVQAVQKNVPCPSPEPWMTYVVTEACIKCKYTDCVEVCPVDCFYEGENM